MVAVERQVWCSRYTCVVRHPLSSPIALGGGGGRGIIGGGTGSGIFVTPYVLREGGRSTGLLPAEEAVAEYNRLSNQRDPTVKPVLLFRPKDWDENDELQPGKRRVATVQMLKKDEVKQYCPEIGIVQSLANQAVKKAGPRSNYETPWLFGTAAHTNLKNFATANYPNILRAKRSYLKFAEEIAADKSPDNLARYGLKNTVRIDIRVLNGIIVYVSMISKRGERASAFREQSRCEMPFTRFTTSLQILSLSKSILMRAGNDHNRPSHGGVDASCFSSFGSGAHWAISHCQAGSPHIAWRLC